MQQMIKKFMLTAALVGLGLSAARAFTPGGPVNNAGDNWQAVNIGYGSPTVNYNVAPKNLGEGYRRNIPVVYYAYSAEFLDYFGTAGETNVDAAFGLLNAALTNGVASYSPDLSEVQTDPQQINYTAQALQLYDLKSLALSFMMPELGLANPEDNTWKLHDRYLPPGGKCPIDEYYTVIQRNFASTPSDFTQFQYSPYVNNVLYSFTIEEICGGYPVLADTESFPVDPLADSYTSVAGLAEGGLSLNFGTLLYGGFFTGLSSDDVAGLRYLLSTNNVNRETVGAGSLLFDEATNTAGGETLFPANTNSPTGYGTFSYASLLTYSATNTPASVMANFPGVVVASSYYYFTLASNATVTAYFKPPPVGSAFGTLPTLALMTNYTPYLATNYVTTFANVLTVVTNKYTTNVLMTVTTGPQAKAAYGSPLVSITNYQAIVTTNPSGDFYTVPNFGTNLCGSGIIYTGLTSVIYATNLVTSINTNLVTATNIEIFSVTQSVISAYTSHTFVAYPVNCGQTAGATGLYQGINKMQFIRVDYDSLLSQTFTPITNGFSMVAVTNSQLHTQHFDRTVTVPDVLFDAEDLADGNGGLPTESIALIGVPNYDQGNILPGLAGPGVINPTTAFVFNKVGNLYLNGSLAIYAQTTNAFLNQTTQYPLLAYGSFDGTTNPPVIYPNGTSIVNLQNQLLLQITPTSLPNGTNGAPYLSGGSPVQFSLSGGGGAFDLTDPFTWTSTGPPLGGPVTTGLPPGLTLSAAGVLAGTPTQSGTYDFVLIFTDYYSHSVQWNYTITIQ